MVGYVLLLDIIYSPKFAVYTELHSWETVCFSEQIRSTDEYLSTFSRLIDWHIPLSHFHDFSNESSSLKVARIKNAGAYQLSLQT